MKTSHGTTPFITIHELYNYFNHSGHEAHYERVHKLATDRRVSVIAQDITGYRLTTSLKRQSSASRVPLF